MSSTVVLKTHFNDFQQFFWAVYAPYREFMEKLDYSKISTSQQYHIYELQTHQPAESLECPWYSDMWIDFDQHTLCSVNIYLKKASFIKRRIEKCKEAL